MLGAMEEGERLVPGRWVAVGVCSTCRCLWLPTCLRQQVLCRLKPDGHYHWSTGCGHLPVGDFARMSRQNYLPCWEKAKKHL